jgi:hypothetical protein
MQQKENVKCFTVAVFEDRNLSARNFEKKE